MMLGAILALTLVEFHAASGQLIEINPAEVSSLRAPLDIKGHWAPGVHCIIVMSNGGFNGVAESCAAAEQKLQDAK